jgi:polyisoprenoid-binding protein YceI
MKLLLIAPALCAAFVAARPASGPAAATPAAAPQTWTIDPVHSSVVFRVKHANAAWFYGGFKTIKGDVVYDPAKPEAGRVTLEIAADSVDTRDPKRDTHLKSPDFFDAKQFPTISFTSTRIAAAKEKDTFDVTGDLELHGVKKSVTIKVEKTGEGEFQGKRIGFETMATIKRSEFKMDYGIAQNVLGDDVTLKISVECIEKKKD